MIPSYLKEIHFIVDESKILGEITLANGTPIVGHVPHLGSEARLHLIFPPLVEKEIDYIESQPGKDIPSSLQARQDCPQQPKSLVTILSSSILKSRLLVLVGSRNAIKLRFSKKEFKMTYVIELLP
jgi:hypothetical protein